MAEGHHKPAFRGFNPRAPMRVYRRNLPHWRQDGATYFVTFRLADSIPKNVVKGWQEEDRVWLEANGGEKGLTEKAQRDFERRSARRLHVELDRCHGSCLMRQPDVREVVVSALRHFHGERWWVGDFVVMPNHGHGLFQPMTGFELEDVLASVKGFVSTRLTGLGVKSGRFWQDESYDRIVRDAEELAVWRGYIEANPEKARLGEGEYTYRRCDWLG